MIYFSFDSFAAWLRHALLGCAWGGEAQALQGSSTPSPVCLTLFPPAPDADLTFEQTAWGDSGVYYCSVVSAQDLQGNNEAYAELIVLGE
jgi:hypothetical protein